MYHYCLGLRLDLDYMELACEYRDRCPYYANNDLGTALSHPEQYQELPTYNSQLCKYFDKTWNISNLQTKETSSTWDILTAGRKEA